MRVSILCCAAAALACGGGSSSAPVVPGSATMSGKVRGIPVTAADSTSAQLQLTLQGGQVVHEAAIVISSAPAICSQMGAGKEPKNTQYLLLALAEKDGSTAVAPKGPGTFPIVTSATTGATRAAAATFLSTDATCRDPVGTTGTQATAGSVTLTAVGTTYTGTFAVTLSTNDQLSGTFTAPDCPGLANVLLGVTGTTCQ
jgi:hypothetical protein